MTIIFFCSEYIFESEDFNFTYFGTKGAHNQSIPLIVALHGGPHSSYCNAFHINYALMVSLGISHTE
jgi:dipeptidyl aminopeptidase/acylaminoacyl peptidase